MAHTAEMRPLRTSTRIFWQQLWQSTEAHDRAPASRDTAKLPLSPTQGYVLASVAWSMLCASLRPYRHTVTTWDTVHLTPTSKRTLLLCSL